MKLITTPDGYVNPARVKKYTYHTSSSFIDGREQRRESWTLWGADGERLGETVDDPSEGNYTIIPADGWEVLTVWDEGYDAEPVIAWRVAYQQYLTPITVSGADWDHSSDYGLRQVGGNKVHMPIDSTYENVEAWLDEMKKRERKKATG